MLLIGLVGVPNCGKSTMLKALTLANVQIADYPFTTIEPNQAVGYVLKDCPCKRLGVRCSPQDSKCADGRRWIPVRLLDVAGLVEGAHEGRGLGNKFLDDLRQATGLIHVLDCSGLTDAEGKPRTLGNLWDPEASIRVLETEVDEWLSDIISKNSEKVENLARLKKIPVERLLAEKLSGLGMTEDDIKRAAQKAGIGTREFATILRRESKPIVIAANKMDVPSSEANLRRLKEDHEDIFPVSAESELALREAAERGLIEYVPGASDFRIVSKDLSEKQRKALEFIRENVLRKYGSTGIQQVLNKAVFEMLQMIVVYPVENEGKFTDKNGNVLPDAILVPKGTTARNFAGEIHTDFKDKFLAAIDARTSRRISADQELKDGDIVKIVLQK